MEKRVYISEFLNQEDIYKDKFPGKLFIYNDFKKDDDKKSDYSGLYYYNEEEKNKFYENYKKSKEKKNNNNNNLFIFNIKNNNKMKEETDDNKMIIKKKSLINFMVKEDKNKNLKVNKIKEDRTKMDLYIKKFKKKDIINSNNNNLLKNRNLSASLFSKFNEKLLENMNTHIIKIISEKIIQLPPPEVCYFKKSFKSIEDISFYKPKKLSKTDICYFKKSYIYNDKKVSLPKSEICYFNRTYITSELKFKNTVLSKRYFCTKIKKKHKRKKFSAKEQNNLKNKKNKGISNKKNHKTSNNNIIKNKRRSQYKEEPKYKPYQNYVNKNNNKLKSFKTVNQDDMFTKTSNKNNFLPKNITHNKPRPKTKTKSKSPKARKYKKIQNLPKLINDQNNNSSSSSSYDRERKHSSLFHHLLNKKEGYGKLIGLKKRKIVLNKHIPNGRELSRNDNKLYMPKIKDTSSLSNSYKTPKLKASPNIKSSHDLIKKLNDDVPLNNKISKHNNNHLFNSVENPSGYNIMNYNHKDIENNFIKCDIHYNTNNLLCPKCQQAKLRLNSLQESKKHKIPNIKKPLLNKNKKNNIMDKVRKDLVLTPLQINNYNNRNGNGSIFENLKRNSKSITVKKINYSKGNNEDMLKNYKSGLLAIKEY